MKLIITLIAIAVWGLNPQEATKLNGTYRIEFEKKYE